MSKPFSLAVSGTKVPLSGDSAIGKGVQMQAKKANTGVVGVYLEGVLVRELSKGEAFACDVAHLADLEFDTTRSDAGDIVHGIYYTQN